MQSEVGKTKAVGYEIGLRKTLPITPERAWNLLMSDPGRSVWLGSVEKLDLYRGYQVTTAEGVRIEVRSAHRGTLIRLIWQPADWEKPSTLQVRVLPSSAGKATISFHQEHLVNAEARKAAHHRLERVVAKLEGLI